MNQASLIVAGTRMLPIFSADASGETGVWQQWLCSYWRTWRKNLGKVQRQQRALAREPVCGEGRCLCRAPQPQASAWGGKAGGVENCGQTAQTTGIYVVGLVAA